MTGGVSYTKSKIQPDPNTPASDIPGYSRWVANGTAYFEKGGFSVRGSMRYRSTFLGDGSARTAYGAERKPRRSSTRRSATISSPTVRWKALALHPVLQPDQRPFVAINPGEPLQVMNYQDYGRRFMGGFTYKF